MIKTLCLGLGLSLSFITKSMANPACVVCTFAVGASLGFARKMGVDDNVVALWSGALLALLGYWLILWFEKKKWNFYGRDFILIASSVAMIGFMYISDLTYTPTVILYVLYIDSFLFTTILGALLLIYSSFLYQWMKENNGGRAHFPFEKVVLPVAILAATSVYLQYYPIN